MRTITRERARMGDIMMMSPKRQKTVVTIFVVVLGLAMVLGMIGRGVG